MFSCASCGNNGKLGPEAVAGDFLKAYFAGEYENAVTFCTDTLSSALRSAIDSQEYESDEIREAAMEMSRNTGITVVKAVKGKDACSVSYELSLPDSTKVLKDMVLEKIGGVWKVSSIN
ncbi:MAG: DUF4878 domain-containing protein [Bacteroidales bacterium]|jgi:hypothetical protein|nr:DUF4878 domain-containing protein [Bacteroidales bacterium]